MNSPVLEILQKSIKINRQDQTAIYLQLGYQIINAIQLGYIPAGTKLPGTRILAESFQIHRKTAVAAYEELCAQGWIAIYPNKGTYVLKEQQIDKQVWRKERADNQILMPYQATKTAYILQENIILSSPFEDAYHNLQLSDGHVDLRLVDIKRIVHFYSAAAKRKHIWKNISTKSGLPTSFIEYICSYLNLTRGLRVPKSNILTTRNKQTLLYATARSIIKQNDMVLVAQISDYKSNMIFAQCGAQLSTIPIDQDGLDIIALKKLLKRKKIRALYTNAQHHYPTTITLSAQRRTALIALAKKYEFILIEDDDQAEFTYEKSMQIPMIAADTEGRMIYLSVTAGHLPAGYQTAILVAPPNLLEQVRNQLQILDNTKDLLMEYTLAEMIQEGEILRSLKKNLKVYEQRRNYCCTRLIQVLGKWITLEVPKSGLAVWVVLPNNIPLLRLKKKAEKLGLFIPKHILYQNKDISAIRWGFAEHTEAELDKCISLFASALQQCLTK